MDSAQPTSTLDICWTAKGGQKHRPQSTLTLQLENREQSEVPKQGFGLLFNCVYKAEALFSYEWTPANDWRETLRASQLPE